MKKKSNVFISLVSVVFLSVLFLFSVLCGKMSKTIDNNLFVVRELKDDRQVSSTDLENDVSEAISYPQYPSGKDAPGVKASKRSSKYYIVVFLGSQSTVVYGKDNKGYYSKVIKSFTCSTGIEGHSTPTGIYSIGDRYEWCRLVGDVYGIYTCRIGGHYLFHSVPFYKQDASTLNEEEYDKLGSPASHGCIRLCVRDSKWIYDNVPRGTQVNVTKEAGLKGDGVPERDTSDPKYSGWDPSDVWSKNSPYYKCYENGIVTIK